MPARSVILLVFGLVIALGIAYSLKSRTGESGGAKVLVAASDIPAGAFVRSDFHLKFAPWPEDSVTPNMLSSQAVTTRDFEGAVARRAIPKGEAISKNALVKSNEGGFLSAVLEPGLRAVSIAVDPTTGNAGFISPGDKVDLILTHTIGSGDMRERASETFIENVRVLAVDQMLENPENKAVLAKTVTLEVSPKQAEQINVAKDLGKISLSLRSLANAPITALDAAVEAATEPATLNDVLDGIPQTTPARPQQSHVTRDTDVSKIISPRDGAGSRVRILRTGEDPQIIEFNREATSGAQ
jgi:pilus assembly protein CpaB